ncbi:MAG: SOS response-associated peptidase [Planctomycetota bacterium]
MCGRFTLATAPEIVAEFFELTAVPDLSPRYNIAPTQSAPAILLTLERAQRVFRPLRWGLIPGWAKDPTIGNRMINARAETVAEKPAFRSAFRQRRCLVVSDGFYEWRKGPGRKQPFYIRMRDDRPFAFAGLWEHWEAGDGTGIDSCALLTTQPNTVLRPIHDRMPVILDRANYDLWLDPTMADVDRLRPLLCPYRAEEMKAYPVGARVNSPTRDDRACIEPA